MLLKTGFWSIIKEYGNGNSVTQIIIQQNGRLRQLLKQATSMWYKDRKEKSLYGVLSVFWHNLSLNAFNSCSR